MLGLLGGKKESRMDVGLLHHGKVLMAGEKGIAW